MTPSKQMKAAADKAQADRQRERCEAGRHVTLGTGRCLACGKPV